MVTYPHSICIVEGKDEVSGLQPDNLLVYEYQVSTEIGGFSVEGFFCKTTF